jgi:hypothetical protein
MRAVVPVERDLRLDLFRGLSLWLLFLDQLPSAVVSAFAIRSYGFSDATEIIVFVFGYTAGFVYGPLMRERGFVVATANILRRAWQVYVAHVFLFVFYIAEIAYVSRRFDNPLFAEDTNIFEFLHRPDMALFQGLTLNFKPVHMDVLPLYILLLVAFAPVLWLLLRRPALTLAASTLLYVLSRRFGWNLRAYPAGEWPLNPFAWQFLFVLAAWCGLGLPRTVRVFLHSRSALILAVAYLALSLAMVTALFFPRVSGYVPTWLADAIYPIDKTDLDPVRFAHVLALAAVAVHFVPPDWAALKWRALHPLIRCGEHLVEVFCVSIFLTFAAQSIFVEIADTVPVHLLAGALGIAIMSAVAQFISWFEPLAGVRLPAAAGAQHAARS